MQIKYGIKLLDYPTKGQWLWCGITGSGGHNFCKEINWAYKDKEKIERLYPTLKYVVEEYKE